MLSILLFELYANFNGFYWIYLVKLLIYTLKFITLDDSNILYTNYFKSSSTFILPLLERRMPADGPRLVDYAEADLEMRNLIVTSSDTAAIVYVEHDGRCTMHAGLSLKKENGVVTKVLMNNSNTEFAPGMTDGEILKNYVTVITRRDASAEPFGVKGRELKKDEISNSSLPPGGQYYLASYPRALLVGYVEDGWLEGNVHEPTFVDAFQDKYGLEAGLWIKRAQNAVKNHQVDCTVYQNLKSDGVLDECLAESFALGLVTEGSVLAFTSTINQASNPTEYEAIKRCVAPFQEIAVPQQVSGGGELRLITWQK